MKKAVKTTKKPLNHLISEQSRRLKMPVKS